MDTQENTVVSSFQKYVEDFMASYQTNSRERVTELGGGWVKEIYRTIGKPSIDVKKTDSLMSPYVGICAFTLRSDRTAFYKTKEEAAKDNKFVESTDCDHRHRYAYKSEKWVSTTREYHTRVDARIDSGEWYDCNEVVDSGGNAGVQDLFGCWETN
jgi:hypothetical protein